MNEIEYRAMCVKEIGYDCYDLNENLEVIPVLFFEAVELFRNDVAVLLLYDDGGEAYADSVQDIFDHAKKNGRDMFGIECDRKDEPVVRRILPI